jgi:hypothetical protein
VALGARAAPVNAVLECSIIPEKASAVTKAEPTSTAATIRQLGILSRCNMTPLSTRGEHAYRRGFRRN